MQVIERTKGHYDVQKVQFGTVYMWCPEYAVVECDCGERTALTRLESTCPKCGTDHATIIREELAARQLRDEVAHPWRYARDREDARLPC